MSTPTAPRRGLQLLGGLAAAGLAVVLVAVGCQPDEPDGDGFEQAGGSTVVRLTGSNTIGSALAPELAEGYLAAKGATDVRRETTGSTVTVTGTPAESPPVRFEIAAGGTESGFTALREGAPVVAMASRGLTEAEAAGLASRGELLGRASEHVLALDAVAVVVPRANPVKALSMAQLREVFTCRIRDWSQVGGAPGPIRVLARDTNSGTFELFRDRVLGGQPLCADAELYADSAALSDDVAADPSAIGFVGLPFVGGNHAVELYDTATTRTGPTPVPVSTETYLLTRRLLLYLPTQPVDDPVARDFVESYALGPAGQAIVARAGFLSPYTTPPPQTQPCTADVPEYCAAVAGAERVPFDVRFASGTVDVDNRAVRNLDLFAGAITQASGAGRQVLLVGFADNAGADAANLTLSQQRADAVAAALAARGVGAVQTIGFGEALAVATNDTPDGRDQNRRVEVWVR